MGYGSSIVAVRPQAGASEGPAPAASMQYPHPRPRLVGFSPLVAVTTSDARSCEDFDWVHYPEGSYAGDPIPVDPPPPRSYVIGILDSGSVADLAAGTGTDALGLYGTCRVGFVCSQKGPCLTDNFLPIGGVGGSSYAYVSQPLGLFAAGLSAVDSGGMLDYGALVGHSNVSMLAAPPIICEEDEVVSVVVGTPFLSLFTTVIRVDTPRTVTIDGETFAGPDVQIQDPSDPLPPFSRRISIEPGMLGAEPALTATYFPQLDDLITPWIPTLFSSSPLSLPFGGAYFTTIQVSHGDSGLWNMRVLVDTGAQSSIISPTMAGYLSLPLEGDFTVDVCGVGGLVEDVNGFYIDYVRIPARDGALEFSRAPFVELALTSPEGGDLDGVLGMNFFWNRNVIMEAALGSSNFLDVSDPIPVPYGDSDVDFDVDIDDLAMFASCSTGAGWATLSPECDHLDSDQDGDVDLTEFARFQICFSGSGVTADPDCAQ